MLPKETNLNQKLKFRITCGGSSTWQFQKETTDTITKALDEILFFCSRAQNQKREHNHCRERQQTGPQASPRVALNMRFLDTPGFLTKTVRTVVYECASRRVTTVSVRFRRRLWNIQIIQPT